jgi:hypothetical protein
MWGVSGYWPISYLWSIERGAVEAVEGLSNRESSSAVPVDYAGRRPPLTAISIVADTVWLNTCVASFTFFFM